jgi:hypothetical protein
MDMKMRFPRLGHVLSLWQAVSISGTGRPPPTLPMNSGDICTLFRHEGTQVFKIKA